MYQTSALQARSLLTAHEDFTTLMFTSPTEIQRPGLVFSFLKKHMPSEDTVEEVKRMSLTADGKSAVFDVPTKLAQVHCCTLLYPEHILLVLHHTLEIIIWSNPIYWIDTCIDWGTDMEVVEEPVCMTARARLLFCSICLKSVQVATSFCSLLCTHSH